jgi:hypothetical protein
MDGWFDEESRLAPVRVWPHKYIYGRYQKSVGDSGTEGFTSFDLFGYISQTKDIFEEKENPRRFCEVLYCPESV